MTLQIAPTSALAAHHHILPRTRPAPADWLPVYRSAYAIAKQGLLDKQSLPEVRKNLLPFARFVATTPFRHPDWCLQAERSFLIDLAGKGAHLTRRGLETFVRGVAPQLGAFDLWATNPAHAESIWRFTRFVAPPEPAPPACVQPHVTSDPDERVCAACGGKMTWQNADLTARREEVTFLILDVADSEAQAERMPPEIWEKTIRRLFALIKAHVRSDDDPGLLATRTGTWCCAIFGSQPKRKEHPVHAVSSALKILDGVQNMNGELATAGHEPLQLRIGIHTGKILWVPLGESEQEGLGGHVHGIARRIARELEMAAPAGGMVVSEATRERLGDQYEVEPLGALAVPFQSDAGDAVQVPYFLVLGKKPDAVVVTQTPIATFAVRAVDGDGVEIMNDTDTPLAFRSADGKKEKNIAPGETVQLRLFGVDAPESDQPWGDRAKDFLNALVVGKNVTVHPRDIDKYGRPVVEVTLQENGQSVAEALAEAGLAWWASDHLKDPESSIAKAHRAARADRRGLWSEPEARLIEPWKWRKLTAEEKRKFHLGEGVADGGALPAEPAASPPAAVAAPELPPLVVPAGGSRPRGGLSLDAALQAVLNQAPQLDLDLSAATGHTGKDEAEGTDPG